MSEETSILVGNLVEAFKQLNQFVTLGLVTSMSALALEYQAGALDHGTGKSAAPVEKVSVIGGFAPVSREAAQLLCIAVCYVAAVMGSYSLQSISYIVGRLGATSPLVDAACTYSSVATGPIGIRIVGAALPGLLAGVVIGRNWWKLRSGGLFLMLVILVGSYAIFGLGMGRIPCTPH